MNTKPLTLRTIIREYNDDEKARVLIESLRWPNGPVCPNCGSTKVHTLKSNPTAKKPVKPGTYKCGNKDCMRDPENPKPGDHRKTKVFTVRVGTVLEESHLPLGNWLVATILMCSSKKGISAKQIQRLLGLSSYQTAWFLCHRIRHAMAPTSEDVKLSGIVEADETYVGGKPRKGKKYDFFNRPHKGRSNTRKTPVVALVERGGDVRTGVVANVNVNNLRKMMIEHVDVNAQIHTDEWAAYPKATKGFKGGHKSVTHGRGQYARNDSVYYGKKRETTRVHCNTAESFFALVKRSIYGTWHQVGRKHLHRYVNEVAFKWNLRKVEDGDRLVAAIKLFNGKRLTYRRLD